MVYLSLGLALIGLFMAWQANRKNKELQNRIGQIHSRLFQVRRDGLEAQEAMQQELTRLRFELLKTQGRLQISGEMTMDEVLMVHPMAGQVLAGFHVGGCSSCAVDGSQRLDLALASSGQPLEPVLVALNKLLQHEQNGATSPDLLKTPNVELTFE